MPIVLPNLDDRRWADLVEEGLTLLPVYAPTWTDHNPSDPGVTLVELFAWLTEQALYRGNRITDRHRTKFLELIQELVRPARAARSVLSFRVPALSTASFTVPRTTEFVSKGGTVFRTLHPLRVGPASLCVVQSSEGHSFRAFEPGAADGFAPFGNDPRPDNALYLGFDAPFSPGETMSLYVSMGEPGAAEALRSSLFGESLVGASTSLERARTCDCAECSLIRATPGQRWALHHHHSVRLTYEYLAESGRWLPVQVRDGTRQFTVAGSLTFALPPGSAPMTARIGSVPSPFYYVRCRFVSGRFDEAPHVREVFENAVEVEQAQAWHGATSEAGLVIGRGTGDPSQRMVLPTSPLVACSLTVWSVGLDGNILPWAARADLAASGPTDRHFVLDPVLGELSFGDGLNGRPPEKGRELLATFRGTDGERGRVAVQSFMALADTPHNHALALEPSLAALTIGMPVASHGGADAETFGQAFDRIAAAREAPQRAVTLDDYESLALATAGVKLARAHALANHHPTFECVKAPGLITIIVVPHLPVEAPQPSAGVLAAVRRNLARRRILGTRFEVVGPTYLKVAVRARVRLLQAQRPERVQRDIENALRRFLDPLAGGPDGLGWPFGRDVYRSEIMRVIDDVAGVDRVLELQLLPQACKPVCGDVCLKPTWLTTSGNHEIEVL